MTICPLFPGHVLFLVLIKCVWPFLNHPECPGFSFCVRFCIKALCRNSFLNPAAAEYAKHLNHFECSSCWMQGCQIHICCVEKIRLILNSCEGLIFSQCLKNCINYIGLKCLYWNMFPTTYDTTVTGSLLVCFNNLHNGDCKICIF